MLFNSYSFLILFLPLVLGISLKLKGQPLLRWITLTSFVFYSFAGHVWFLVPMLITTVLDFFMAQKIAISPSIAKKRLFLMISIVGNLGLLIYFKYSGLLVEGAEWIMNTLAANGNKSWSLSMFEVILPAGISFYTFQTLSYIIDVYRGTAKPEKNFWLFTSFVSFFPHLVAGPLTRHNQLIPQLEHIASGGIRARWEHGIYLFAVGLCKKVLIGDRIASLIYPLIGNAEDMNIYTAWLAVFAFTMQIYFDFSAYSDMAIGLGRLFGIELPQNFNSPYKAHSPRDFWLRWHITLSRWLRDYLYITLGGNRCSAFRRNVNLMITMVLGGLWHGANWTFGFWGFYHGMLLVLFHTIEKPWSHMPMFIQRGATFLLVAIGWLFFRADSWAEACLWFGHLFDFSTPIAPLSRGELKLTGLVLGAFILTQIFPNASARPNLATLKNWQKFILGCMTFGAMLMLNYSSKFLYFQF